MFGTDAEIFSGLEEAEPGPSDCLLEIIGTPDDVGSLVEPLAVGHHAVQRAELTGDDTVLVVAGGPIGQAVALAARRLGVATVVVAELDAVRRDLVTRLGFDAVDPATQSTHDITAVLGGRATVVVDAVGTSRTLQTALDTSTLGARIVLVGMGAPRVEISAYAVSTEERTILGSFSYDEAGFRETAEWSSAHAAELAPLIDARVDLADAPETFRALANGELRVSKVLVYPSGSPATGADA